MLDINISKILEDANSKLKNNGKIIYLSLGGSHLFGLNTEQSDIDIKGLFLPSTIDICASKPTYINLSTNKSMNKNSNIDIDIELFSIPKYFEMLKVGDTNAYDLLFSMFRQDTILYQTPEIVVFKNNYRELLSAESKSFLGYVLAQTKKYGVKGERYNALVQVINNINIFTNQNQLNSKKNNIKDFITFIKPLKLEYVSIDTVADYKNTRSIGDGTYLNVLDKQYEDTIKFDYFQKLLEKRLEKYGARSKQASQGIDFKSLSHAYRIILEFEEILDTHFLKLPLNEKEKIMKVKKGDLSDFDNDYKNILSFLNDKVENIKERIEYSGLPDKINPLIFNKLFILLLSDTTT